MPSPPRPPVVLAVCGPSGAGKSSVAAALGRRVGWRRIDEGFDRLRPRPDLRFGTPAELRSLEWQLLAEEARRYREARAAVAAGTAVVADTAFLDPVGYTVGLGRLGLADPRSVREVVGRAVALAEAGRLGLADLTVYLRAPRALRRARASADPRRHPPSLRSRHERVGEVDARLVRAALARAAPGRVRGVRADRPVAEIARRLAGWAARTEPFPRASEAAVTALRELARLGEPPRAAAAPRNLKRGTLSPRAPR